MFGSWLWYGLVEHVNTFNTTQKVNFIQTASGRLFKKTGGFFLPNKWGKKKNVLGKKKHMLKIKLRVNICHIWGILGMDM